MKKVNSTMILQWVLFLPLILPLGLVSGAIDGMKKILIQAKEDIFEKDLVA